MPARLRGGKSAHDENIVEGYGGEALANVSCT